jgi:hypothetical protein
VARRVLAARVARGGDCAKRLSGTVRMRPTLLTARVAVQLTVPTFKGFTPALMAIAERVPSATLLSVSNNAIIQVVCVARACSDVGMLQTRLSLKSARAVEHFLSQRGCSMLSHVCRDARWFADAHHAFSAGAAVQVSRCGTVCERAAAVSERGSAALARAAACGDALAALGHCAAGECSSSTLVCLC